MNWDGIEPNCRMLCFHVLKSPIDYVCKCRNLEGDTWLASLWSKYRFYFKFVLIYNEFYLSIVFLYCLVVQHVHAHLLLDYSKLATVDRCSYASVVESIFCIRITTWAELI